jgi:hypothetical protein
MDLPLVIDVAIGLLFIYLTLSLLASEFQELITTVLQWRAEHLKKSIENLLTSEEFANKLYKTPLIKALNQGAKGNLAQLFRHISENIVTFYHSLTGARNVFGNERSGPSYIPPDTFSVALLQQINIEELSQKISELIARRFGREKLALVKQILDALRNSLGDDTLLQDEFRRMEQSLESITEDFVSRRITLSDSIQQATEQLTLFIDNTANLLCDNNYCQEIIRGRLPYLRQAIARQPLEPTVVEVLQLIFAEVAATRQGRSRLSPQLTEIAASIRQDYPELLQQISELPDELKKNLLTLAKQVQLKVEGLEAGVRQLEKEVAIWFDNSMERASGVYKRNAKGVAIIIGVLIAVTINADTLYIVSRLSKDTILRSTINEAANGIITPVDSVENVQTDLQSIKDAVNSTLEQLPLPIGWDAVNVGQQRQESHKWPIPFLLPLVGWTLTGIALSMGATFWFDLLSKIMRIRNTGRKIDT